MFGILALVGGWNTQIRTGQHVQIDINNQWVDGIVVDDGLGKKRISVILEDDDNLHVQKVALARVRPNSKYEWPFDSSLGDKINQDLLCRAIINVFENNESSLTNATKQLLTEQLALMLLLKVSAQLKWSASMDPSTNPIFCKFLEILGRITKDEGESEDKTKNYWEKAFAESWERIIDKSEDRNHDLFVLRDNFLKEQDHQGLSLDKKPSSKVQKPELKQGYIDNEFVQPLSSYLKGLPDLIPKKNQHEAALKMLAYWEKNIIPKIVEFVRTTYKPWEMEFYFEQLRHHLRNGDQAKALDDAMTMCERKMPQGCTPPDDNYDWTSKMPDECIVDSWALAKFKQGRSSGSSGNQQAQNSQKPSDGQHMNGETSYPLLNKLIDLGIEEIVVLIKAVDMRDNVVLGEYWDHDAMQVHSLWIPINFLNDLNSPLPPRSVGYTMTTLKK